MALVSGQKKTGLLSSLRDLAVFAFISEGVIWKYK